MGEILYMESKAQYRDQVSWACSAQEPKMLPTPEKKVSSGSSQLKGSASKHFHDEPINNNSRKSSNPSKP